MSPKLSEEAERRFGAWWKREEESGLGLSDPFEVGVIQAVARSAFASGWRSSRRAPIGSEGMGTKLGTMLIVGATRFHEGVKVETAQAAIDRLVERHRKLSELMLQVQEFEHRLPPSLSTKIKNFYTSGA